MKKKAGSSFDLWGIFLQTYLPTFLEKQRVEHRHRIVTTYGTPLGTLLLCLLNITVTCFML